MKYVVLSKIRLYGSLSKWLFLINCELLTVKLSGSILESTTTNALNQNKCQNDTFFVKLIMAAGVKTLKSIGISFE